MCTLSCGGVDQMMQARTSTRYREYVGRCMGREEMAASPVLPCDVFDRTGWLVGRCTTVVVLIDGGMRFINIVEPF